MRVPFFDMRAELGPVRGEIDRAIARVLDSGVFIGGPEVESFECAIAEVEGVAHAVGTSSGTDALHLIYLALGLGPGDAIVTTPLTFFSTVGSAARLGVRVVFADIEDDTLCLDPRLALAAVDDATRAVVTVNLFGRLAALGDLVAARPVIEDAAHSLGAGSPRGVASALSFFPTKNLGALGDAGAALTADPELATRMRLLRSHGAKPKYHHIALGGNFRLDALQAAVLSAKLGHLASWRAARRALAARYRAAFATAGVPPELRMPRDTPEHVYHQFVIRAPRRDALRRYLRDGGIETEVYYPEPLHLQPCFARLGYRAGSLPNAERACTELLALPIHPALSPEAQDHVIDRVVAFFRGA